VGCRERLGGLLRYDYRDAAWNRRFEFLDTTGPSVRDERCQSRTEKKTKKALAL